jgi:hypothetical protein
MPYFIVLPFYSVFLISLLLGAGILFFFPNRRGLAAYLCGGAIGSIPGIIIANGLLFALIKLSVLATNQANLPNLMRSVAGFIIAGQIFIGPFLVSIVGVLAGFALGLYSVDRLLQKNGG